MKARMRRKMEGVREWYERENLVGGREQHDSEEVIVEKRIELGEREFREFCECFLLDRRWIAETCEQTLYKEDGWHCLAVTSRNSDIAILVAAEGYSYARYTAVVPKKDLAA
jgi:hypothetical protein